MQFDLDDTGGGTWTGENTLSLTETGSTVRRQLLWRWRNI